MEREAPVLETPRLILRMGESSDIPEVIQYFRRNEERFRPTHPSVSSDFYTETFWRDEIQKRHAWFQEERSIKVFIFRKESPIEICGTANLSEIIRGLFQACFLGYDLDGKYEGRGYMFEALSALVQHAFEDLNLHRLMANYQPHNVRSAAVLKRLGFVIEGTAKDYLFLNGAWRDHVLTSLTNRNWKNEAVR